MSDGIDLTELRQGFREVLSAEAGPERVRRHVHEGGAFDRDLAGTIAGLGWSALGVAEADGGLGLGLPALAVLYEELGRGPACLPLMTTLLVIDALKDAPDSVRGRWLPPLMSGDLFAALALDVGLSAGERVTGRAVHVLHGDAAGLFLLSATDGRHLLVPREAAGLTVLPTALVDRTRGAASLDLSDTPVLPVPVDGAALRRHTALALACDSVGGADAILEKTVEYLKIRTQFGQPIGGFQALKHRTANHKLRLESARALVDLAVRGDGDGQRVLALAHLARAHAVEAYVTIADDAVQLHGGIGFTWEHECHHYLKRAWLNRALFGGEDVALDAAAALLTEDVA
ncbi:acyl-CoA dehydrogenase family protein [Niveispirillum sp.]|uniref:acyl-CoA dehydrogenase family protein n=1 Tax=Niveispirillum sp. TaxID=1917217 RepID=UPI001B70A531|nr:acyl-CoA dehydrogenase family protein [Niveispirillum sp.]MBP7334197.1 acyl-CoA/acyl-ACP dehydrogenase [Niveispirillum sp.]